MGDISTSMQLPVTICPILPIQYSYQSQLRVICPTQYSYQIPNVNDISISIQLPIAMINDNSNAIQLPITNMSDNSSANTVTNRKIWAVFRSRYTGSSIHDNNSNTGIQCNTGTIQCNKIPIGRHRSPINPQLWTVLTADTSESQLSPPVLTYHCPNITGPNPSQFRPIYPQSDLYRERPVNPRLSSPRYPHWFGLTSCRWFNTPAKNPRNNPTPENITDISVRIYPPDSISLRAR